MGRKRGRGEEEDRGGRKWEKRGRGRRRIGEGGNGKEEREGEEEDRGGRKWEGREGGGGGG